ncbi:hypothetical protein [Streptomyces sp. NPDC050738]|uniref:hypothetical protein n=1 Tax=Streptomyces sp. NPDC050738 TaxID=3154744 RepID=UPI003446C82D
MTDWTPVVEMLDKVAGLLDEDAALDPDGAVRLAIWGSPNIPYPDDDNAPGTELFDAVENLIEGYIANQDGHDCGDGIDWIPADRAAAACRAEAARFRSLGYGN